jgi:16S rRNA (uracil1498-N3)-methyltransferase
MLPYFYQPLLGATGETQVLDEETSRHCVQVLRMRSGDALRLTNGTGALATAHIEDAHKKHCGVRILQSETMVRSTPAVTLAVSPLKNTGRFEWLLEKITELGVTEIVPLICRRTEKVYFKPERMRSIVISAMLQSQQCWLPQLHPPVPLEGFLKQAAQQQKFIAHCMEGEKPLLNTLINSTQTHLVMIGPEGDFTPVELQLALQQGFIPVSLGTTRLRTETAGIAAAVLLTTL